MEERSRVFVIDIEVDLCLLMKTYFLRKNYEVYISHTCNDALLRIKDYKPSIICLSTFACQNQEEDIRKLKEFAPDAEIFVDGYPF